MSFRSLLIFLTFLTVLSRAIAGSTLLFIDSHVPIMIQLFSGALVLYGIGLLVYRKFKTLGVLPFVVLFLSEAIIYITNLFIINHHYEDTWYHVHFPMFERIVIGSFIDVVISLVIVFYYIRILRRGY